MSEISEIFYKADIVHFAGLVSKKLSGTLLVVRIA